MQSFHVVIKALRSEPIFIDREILALFFSRLPWFLDVGGFVIAYAVLPNHVHLLVRVPDAGALGRAMSAVMSPTAKCRNGLIQQAGVVFQRPFWRAEVLDAAYLRHLCYYIHANLCPGFERTGQLNAGGLSSHTAWHGVRPAWLEPECAIQAFGGLPKYHAYCAKMAGRRRLPAVRPELDPHVEHWVLAFARSIRMHPDTLLNADRGGTPERMALAQFLRRRSLSVVDTAAVLGVGRSTISRWAPSEP